MKVLLTTAAIAAMALIPATASAQFGGLNTNSLFGGTAGAGIGGVIGSQIAGSGNRTEGAVIGAVVGGLAGSTLANAQNNQFNNGGFNNSGFNGRSNARYSSGGFVPAGGFGAPVGGGFVPTGGFVGAPGGFGVPAGGGFVPTGGFVSGPVVAGGSFGAPTGFPPRPLPSTSFSNGGFVSGPITPVTTTRPRVQQTIVRQRTIQAPPRVIPGRVIQRAPVVVTQPCPTGTTQQRDGSCLSAPRTVRAPAPTVIPALCPAGTTDLGNGTCQEPAKQVFAPAPIVIPQACPAGTTDLGNGTCQEPQKQVFAPPPIVVPQPCPDMPRAAKASLCSAATNYPSSVSSWNNR